MDKKSKILLLIMALLILVSVGVSFYYYFILKDYQIVAETSCDPAVDNCFVRTEEDGTTTHYMIISRNASNIPLCDPALDTDCRALVCEPGEPKCEITTCSAETVPEGEECSR
jgi:hypothetical protein